MCPVCLTTALAWVTASVTSTGGVSALIVTKVRGKKSENHERASRKTEQAPQQTATTRREICKI